jgi:ribosomal RNA-processing protein 12
VLTPILLQTEILAPLIRSSVGCLESLLLVQDSAAWSLSQAQGGPRQAVGILLTLAVDGRPKVRRRASEALTNILQHPPPGPALDHPAAELAATVSLNNLQNVVKVVTQAKKHKGRPDDSHDPSVIHALQLVKTIVTASGGWPSKRIEQLCELLLSISRSRNEYLVMSAFEVFEVIFESMKDEVSSSKLPRLLEAITELKPAQNDSQLLPPWIAILSRGYGVAAESEPEDTFAKLPELFDLVCGYLTSPSHNIRVSASECLISFFANCILDSVILEPSIYDEKTLEKIAGQASDLLSVKYQTAWKEVFDALAALFDALRWRGDPYLLPIVKAIGDLRGNDAFQGKKEADEVLGHAIRNIGPKAFLGVLPHNLIKPRSGQPGRAWLLPLLRDHVSNTELAHFKADLVPLSEVMYQRVIDHGSSEKTMETKIFETVVQQVWATLPGYCDLPLDLEITFDQQFAELLSNLLYKQTELRVDVCRGLQNLVESNQAVVAAELSDEELLFERRITKAQAEKNLQHLAKLSSNLLAVLFNVYSQTLPQSRAYILQCINAYLITTPEKDLVETFERVSKMLESELPKPDGPLPPRKEQTKGSLPPTSHTLLDLIIALSIHLPRATFGSLFQLASSILTNPHLIKADPQLIKKAYKLIPRLSTSPTGSAALSSRNSDLQTLILATKDSTPIPARRDRLLAINTILASLPKSDSHFIPSILSEIVLACKDTNEKARSTGFDLLITCAEKIISSPAGSVIRNSKMPGMSADAPDAPATLEEVFTMASAGLAGMAPHMVAASITALGRLLFEYHDHASLPGNTVRDLVDTVCLFLSSNNREIVRSVLGFVKVMIVVLPLSILEENDRMKNAVRGMMPWSHENKGRMRVKVKGIVERCVRKFGGATVESWVDSENERKMIVNIRKKRERAKRKGKTEGEEDEDQAEPAAKEFDNAYDEEIYGSDDDDSEIMGSDDDSDRGDAMSGVSFKTKKTSASSKGCREKAQYIRADNDEDEPLDLLDPNSMARISSRKTAATKAPRRTKAKTDEDGKLLFGRDDDVLMNGNDENEGGAVDSYVDAISGHDAVRRGQKGRLKIGSGQKKGDREKNPNKAPLGEKMDLDDDDAKAVGQMRGSASPRARGGFKPQQTRKGLGMEKQRGPIGKQFGGAKGRVGKKVSFGGRGGRGLGRR